MECRYRVSRCLCGRSGKTELEEALLGDCENECIISGGSLLSGFGLDGVKMERRFDCLYITVVIATAFILGAYLGAAFWCWIQRLLWVSLYSPEAILGQRNRSAGQLYKTQLERPRSSEYCL
jgi:hypothetical protein